MECDKSTEFKCKSGEDTCILRSFVNNGESNCIDGSDEYNENFDCYEYEFKCLFTNNISNKTLAVRNFNRCLSYDLVRNGKGDCSDNRDETELVQSCTHEHLFLCQDQSRCLPKSFMCDGITQCIDGSDEIERCKYPMYFRFLESDQAFIQNWYKFLTMHQSNKYSKVMLFDAKNMLKEGKKLMKKILFGLKCESDYRFSIKLFCTVPQPNVSSSEVHCLKQEDRCFNGNGELVCFRCFDGTIILTNQVCDGVIDCQDLSDECACENSQAKPLCNFLFTENSTEPIKSRLSSVCNSELELPDGIDEEFCSNPFLSVSEIRHYGSGSNTNRKRVTCSKGPSAFNRRLALPPTDSSYHFNIFLAEGKVNTFNSAKNILFSSSQSYGTTCNRKFECPFREDECSQKCFLKFETVFDTHRFLRCFSFIFRQLEVSSIFYSLYRTKPIERRFYFKDLKLIYLPSPYSGNETVHKIEINSRSVLKYVNRKENISFDFDGNLFKICKENFLECPWFFRCDYNKNEIIDIDKVCDFNFDCKDQSDEKYCSNKSHFNCTKGNIVSISRKKVNENQLDCADRSDECKENTISSVEEMIKNKYLRYFVWISFLGIVVFNLIVITSTLKQLKNIDNKHSIKYYNVLFVLNLSFSDIILGFVVGTIAFLSTSFSGKYCEIDLEWRSSFLCKTLGALTLFSSQTSLNLLVLMTSFRLYTIYRPFKSLDDIKFKIKLILFVCWIVSFLLSITPIVLKSIFLHKFVISNNILFNNQRVDRIINNTELFKLAKNIENIWTATKPNSVPASKSIYNVLDFKDWYLNSDKFIKQYPNTSINIKKKFGFYSSSSVCLPDFYSKFRNASIFSIFLVSLNLFLIVGIVIGYFLIFYNIRSKTVKNHTNRNLKVQKRLMIRIFLIVFTDVASWLPVIVFTYASYLGYEIPKIVHPVSSIVLLPINSLLNPILYSRIELILFKLFKQVIFANNVFKKKSQV